MTENDGKPQHAKTHDFSHLRVLHMRVVQGLLDQGKYVDGTKLAAALRQEAGKPVPPQVLDYLCRYLEGDVAKPKGRKPQPASDKRWRDAVVRYQYRRFLTWLQGREARYGHLEGWPRIRGAEWWQGPPNERAARIVAHGWWYGVGSWRTVQRIASSQK